MRIRTPFRLLVPFALLALFVGCGGAATGPGPEVAPASRGLSYTDPTSSSWRLVRNSASSDTHLILDLVGPSDGLRYRGVGFNLKTDGTVVFARLGKAGYIADTGVFQLKSTFDNYPVEPVLLAGGLKENGTLLTAGIFEKDRYQPSQYVDKAVCQIALDFDPARTAALAPGTRIALKVVKARVVPRAIGTPSDPTDESLANWSNAIAAYPHSIVPVEIAVGTLTTK